MLQTAQAQRLAKVWVITEVAAAVMISWLIGGNDESDCGIWLRTWIGGYAVGFGLHAFVIIYSTRTERLNRAAGVANTALVGFLLTWYCIGYWSLNDTYTNEGHCPSSLRLASWLLTISEVVLSVGAVLFVGCAFCAMYAHITA